MTEEGRGGDAPWWAAMQQAAGVGPATMLRLARAFGSPEKAVRAPVKELMARGGLSAEQAERIAAALSSIKAVEGRLQRLERSGITPCCIGDPGYPPALLDLPSPPPLLYLRGELDPTAPAVAVVGTRDPDARGRRTARALAEGLAARGFTIVSGLARGIDTAAHRGALAAEEGRTAAILGCGLLRIYPPENAILAAQISLQGCLVSEVPPETEVDRRLLLARDRLQAALSWAVIVVQAHAECGSIVTARHARRCRRPLYAVPWETPRFHAGWRKLRGLGARPLEPNANLDELAAEIRAHPPRSEQGLLD